MLHLKKKLDAIKASLPDPDDSPIPSPSVDAPSPTGSESPFHALTHIGTPDPELDGQAFEEDLIAIGDAPSPLSSPGDKDNRDVEDMELSDAEELVEPAIIGNGAYKVLNCVCWEDLWTGSVKPSLLFDPTVEERTALPEPTAVSNQTLAPGGTESCKTSLAAPENETTPPPPAATTPITGPLSMNLAGVDLGKISSIISTLTNVMKNTGKDITDTSFESGTTDPVDLFKRSHPKPLL